MTKGQIESKLSEAISKFEIEQMGSGPEKNSDNYIPRFD